MAFKPIPLGLSQGNSFSSGRVLKTYLAGTTTPTPMYTDSTGGTSTATVLYDSSNMPTVSGSVVFPHIDTSVGDVKYVLYPTQAAADANTGSLYTWDNIQTADDFIQSFATVAEMTAYTGAAIGQDYLCLDYASGNNAGVMYFRAVAAGTGTADGGSYIDHDTLSVQFEQIFGTEVSVKQFGAKGDGVTNDSPSIEAAIDYNSTAARVYFPYGTYYISSQIDINRDSTYLYGDGRGATLFVATGITAFKTANLFGVKYLTFENLRFYGDTNATGAIELGNGFFSAFTLFDKCWFENFINTSSFGVKLSMVQELEFNNCHWRNNYYHIRAPAAASNFVTSTTIRGSSGYIGLAGSTAILLEESVASFKISDVVIESNTGAGVVCSGEGSQITIDGVHFENNGGANAIYVSGTASKSSKLTLLNSFFYNNATTALRTDYCENSEVRNNNGLIADGIITTGNSQLHFQFNTGEDTGVHDAPALYDSLSGEISYIEKDTSGETITKIRGRSGTYTPTLISAGGGTITLSTAFAEYYINGNIVTETIRVIVGSVSTPSGELRLSGSPFYSIGYASNAPYAYSLAAGATTSLQAVKASSTDYIVISKFAAGGVSNLAGDVQAGTTFLMSISYPIAF